jgi:hypothetical protein
MVEGGLNGAIAILTGGVDGGLGHGKDAESQEQEGLDC